MAGGRGRERGWVPERRRWRDRRRQRTCGGGGGEIAVRGALPPWLDAWPGCKEMETVGDSRVAGTASARSARPHSGAATTSTDGHVMAQQRDS
jgi:hypothetical protein